MISRFLNENHDGKIILLSAKAQSLKVLQHGVHFTVGQLMV